MFKVITFFCSVVLLFGGCQQNVQKQKQQKMSEQRNAAVLQESIARLRDIPDIPLQCTVLKIIQSEQEFGSVQIWCHYELTTARTDIMLYYQAEMERLGWKLQATWNEIQEGLLVFIRPSGTTCVISLRENQQMIITIIKKNSL